jgi:hypothetical protein
MQDKRELVDHVMLEAEQKGQEAQMAATKKLQQDIKEGLAKIDAKGRIIRMTRIRGGIKRKPSRARYVPVIPILKYYGNPPKGCEVYEENIIITQDHNNKVEEHDPNKVEKFLIPYRIFAGNNKAALKKIMSLATAMQNLANRFGLDALKVGLKQREEYDQKGNDYIHGHQPAEILVDEFTEEIPKGTFDGVPKKITYHKKMKAPKPKPGHAPYAIHKKINTLKEKFNG